MHLASLYKPSILYEKLSVLSSQLDEVRRDSVLVDASIGQLRLVCLFHLEVACRV